MKHYVPILTIAGSDSSGGAGIQADLKTISAIGCYGMSAITAITAQNTTGVRSVQGVDPAIVTDQIEVTVTDIPPLAIKTGMLYSADIVNAVADCLEQMDDTPLVVDPVMVATSGAALLEPEAVEAIKTRLFPLATLVTPNIAEATVLTSLTDPMAQALAMREMGCRNILIKGGDSDRTDIKVDHLLVEDDDELITLTADAVNTRNTHGTGCTLSAAIACYLALGFDVVEASTRAKLYLTRALQRGATVSVGHGHGPVNHLYSPRHMKYIGR